MSSFLDDTMRGMAKTAEAEAAHERAGLARYCREMDYPITATLYAGKVGKDLSGRPAAEADEAADTDEAWEAFRRLPPLEDSPRAAAYRAGLGDDDGVVFLLEPPRRVGDGAPMTRVWRHPAPNVAWDAVSDDLLIWSIDAVIASRSAD